MSSATDVEAEQLNIAYDFFQWANDNRELCQSITIRVPVVPGGGIDPDLARMLSIWSMVGIMWQDVSHISAGFVESVRAGIAYQFMHSSEQSEQRFLIMIDSDMAPVMTDIWLPAKLANHNRPVVGAIAVVIPTTEMGPTLVFTRKDENGDWRMPRMVDDEGRRMTMPKTGLLEVGHCGTGMICISRECLGAFSWNEDEEDGIPFFIPDKKRKSAYKLSTTGRGEDMEFCSQVRRKGMSVYVDLDAHIGHRKKTMLRMFEDQRKSDLDPSKWVLPAEGIKVGD